MRCVFSKNLLEILSSASLHASFTSHSAKRAVYSINFVIWLRLIWTLRPLLTLPVCFPSSSSPHSQHILQSLLQSTIHNPVQETVFSLRPGKNWIVLRRAKTKLRTSFRTVVIYCFVICSTSSFVQLYWNVVINKDFFKKKLTMITKKKYFSWRKIAFVTP